MPVLETPYSTQQVADHLGCPIQKTTGKMRRVVSGVARTFRWQAWGSKPMYAVEAFAAWLSLAARLREADPDAFRRMLLGLIEE